jgi:MscS family membrane protein
MVRDPSIVTTYRAHSRLLFLVFALASALSAQSLGGLLTGKPSSAAAVQPEDPLKRGTPQSAIRGFLEACHNQNYKRAALYLDLQNRSLRQRSTDGPELAKELALLLDRDAHFELSALNDSPGGNAADGLNADRELLVSVPVDGTQVDLYLQREPAQGVGNIWLVSQDSLDRLPELGDFDQQPAFAKKLPAVLVANTLLGTSLWVWFALVLAAIFLSLVSRLLSRLVIGLFKPLAKRYAMSLHAYRLEAFTEPLRLLLSVSAFRAVIEFLDPSALLRDYLLKLLTLLFAIGAAALLMRVIDVIADKIQSRLDSRERALTYSILPLGMRLLKIVTFCVFGLFVLSHWGYNTTTILAGVGVGGLAVALAAQKTIENFFGGVSVVTDRPVLVGDFCQFGGQVGTVEDIGLRSTRIRTLDRTLVTIPNSSFSTMTLENYSRRDRMWFHPTFHLRRGTRSEQVSQFMATVTDILKRDPLVSIGGVPLRFSKIDDQSLHIEVFAYVLTDDYDKFLEYQTKLLLEILKAAEDSGISFAMPIVESLNSNEPSPTGGGASTAVSS